MEVSLREFVERILAEMDRRYEQRFEAQQRATSEALAATKEALTIALAAAEKGASAAVEASRLLALKADEAAEQRIQAHNNIRPWVQSLFDQLAERAAAIERRVSRFENREEGMTLTTKLIVGTVGFAATLIGLYFTFHR